MDLDGVLGTNLEKGNINFTTEMKEGVSEADVVFIAVGTPQKDDCEADLTSVIDVAEEMVGYIDDYTVVVMKSTVPVGTINLAGNILSRELDEGEDFDVVSNPEFLREGKGLYDFFHPSRIIIGTGAERAMSVMKTLYEPFTGAGLQEGVGLDSYLEKGESWELDKEVPLVETDIRSAQMIKYASNAFSLREYPS